MSCLPYMYSPATKGGDLVLAYILFSRLSDDISEVIISALIFDIET